MGIYQQLIDSDGYRDFSFWDEELQKSIDILIDLDTSDESIEIIKKAIEQFPHYYDAHIALFDMLEDRDGKAESAIIENAFNLAIQRLKDENDGSLPDKINWYFVENRHIFRVIYRQADCLSIMREYKKSNRLLNMLLKFHPSDNIGARILKAENNKKMSKKKNVTK